MLYTDKKSSGGTAHPIRTLQVFSVKVAGVQDGVHWPLQVFGVVAARDCLDHNRNVIFQRERDNCQMIHKEVCIPGLPLTVISLVSMYVPPSKLFGLIFSAALYSVMILVNIWSNYRFRI